MLQYNKAYPLFLILLLMQLGCTTQIATPKPTIPPTFDRQAVIENITTEIIIPSHQQFAEATQNLAQTAETFAQEPSQTNFTALQTAWQHANLAWMRCAPFRFNAINESLLPNRIDNRPARTSFIEETIAGEVLISSALIESVGSSSQGLAALEYLLFAPDAFNQLTDARRVAYLVAASDVLNQNAIALLELWVDEYGAEFMAASMDNGDIQGSVNMLVNRLLEETELLISQRLGKPLGKHNGGLVRPDLVEASYSQTAVSRLSTTLNQLHQTYTGGDGIGLDDYLDFLEAQYETQPLSYAIDQQFLITQEAINKIDPSLADAIETDLATVETAYQELRTLLVLLKVDMTNHLGITLTFNDNDGD